MVKLPAPFQSDPKEFALVVMLLTELLADQKVRVRTSPSANIFYKIDSTILSDTAARKGINPGSASTILGEISAVTSLILRFGSEKSVERIMHEFGEEMEGAISEADRKDAAAAISEKIKLVEEHLVTNRVRQKFHSTRASKHEALVGLRWEVAERRYDQDEGDKARGPVAILKFDLATRPEFEFFPMFFGMDEFQRRSFVTECDEDNLDELIDTMRAARAKLQEVRGK